MRKYLWPVLAAILVSSPTAFAQTQDKRAAPARRAVAVTFDDLPLVSTRRDDTHKEVTRKLLAAVKANKVPAIGFVNEIQLQREGMLAEWRVGLLRMWLDAGLELGNHTFSHPSLNRMPLEEFQQNVVRGEEVTARLLKAKGMKLRYFRHPFLHTGRDLETKRKFEEFLTARGYRIAPVTIDNSEWIFARAYENAILRNDAAMMKRIGDAYVPYMEQKFAYFEQQSSALFGREIKQVLLLHANALNGDYFDPLARMIKRRGYDFITLDEALTDKAYSSPDTYTGPGGITWLHRWAMTAGKPSAFFKGEPRTPAFVMKEAGVESE